MNKETAQQKLNAAKTKFDLYALAGDLNNRPEHVNQDQVTFMGFMDFDQAVKHVAKMIQESWA